MFAVWNWKVSKLILPVSLWLPCGDVMKREGVKLSWDIMEVAKRYGLEIRKNSDSGAIGRGLEPYLYYFQGLCIASDEWEFIRRVVVENQPDFVAQVQSRYAVPKQFLKMPVVRRSHGYRIESVPTVKLAHMNHFRGRTWYFWRGFLVLHCSAYEVRKNHEDYSLLEKNRGGAIG